MPTDKTDNQQVERVDHAEEARRMVTPPDGLPYGFHAPQGPEIAQVHASLAIAEQLERLNDTLSHVVAEEGPGGCLKVRNG